MGRKGVWWTHHPSPCADPMPKPQSFDRRRVGHSREDRQAMLKAMGLTSLDALVARLVPPDCRFTGTLDVPHGADEVAALEEIAEKIGRNTIAKAMIGQGYHGTHLPPVIQRGMMENPQWYGSPPPAVPEASQGSLEMLFHFQTLVTELTGLPMANASMVDESAALGEAIELALRYHHDRSDKRARVVVANDLHPQVLGRVKGRYRLEAGAVDKDTCAMVLQWPDTHGRFGDPAALVASARRVGALVIVVADPLSLVLLEPPGAWGADICVGSMQRFGLPMANGGPHAAYFAVRADLVPHMPGWWVERHKGAGKRPVLTLKKTGKPARVPALWASMATAFAVWHGPDGLAEIAHRIHSYASRFAKALVSHGFPVEGPLFDTVTVHEKGRAAELVGRAERWGLLLRQVDENTVSIAFDETSNEIDLQSLCAIFDVPLVAEADGESLLPALRAKGTLLPQSVFQSDHTEAAFKAFLNGRVALNGVAGGEALPNGHVGAAQTMSAAMMPLSWEITNNLHPFAPPHHRQGYGALLDDLDRWLSSMTGFARCSFQPETGLSVIRTYHAARGEGARDICLVPASAGGVARSHARKAGFEVVVIDCEEDGQISLSDLDIKCAQHRDNLATLLLTSPSGPGLFDKNVRDVCAIVHGHGGQVFWDGPCPTAMIGLVRPGDLGVDVCRVGLHGALGVPVGGGTPHMHALAAAPHLVEHLPCYSAQGGKDKEVLPLSVSLVLPIVWMTIRLLGAAGLRKIGEDALLSANYVAANLRDRFAILNGDSEGLCGENIVLDFRHWQAVGLTVDDFANRLMDYGIHPSLLERAAEGMVTVSLAGGESRAGLDHFIAAMNAIAMEADTVVAGQWPREDNPLVNAPHTAADLMVQDWHHPYSRAVGSAVGTDGGAQKYWPPVNRIEPSLKSPLSLANQSPLADHPPE
ncbi:MAG: glycine dehydrogenase (aminomethyl-transferring) [Pseudomonadota bacterium]